VNLMPRGTPRDTLHDGEIPPATPLPSVCAGPEALRHCLTTVLPSKLLYRAREQTAWRQLQTVSAAMVSPKGCDVKIPDGQNYYLGRKVSSCRVHVVVLRDAIQRLALAHRQYGYRRIAALLGREGWQANHKRVLRLMHEDTKKSYQ